MICKDGKIWTLSISHRYGTEVSLYRTRTGAESSLANYCRTWWGDALSIDAEEKKLTLEPPENDTAVVDAYFETMGESEHYELSLVEVRP